MSELNDGDMITPAKCAASTLSGRLQAKSMMNTAACVPAICHHALPFQPIVGER